MSNPPIIKSLILGAVLLPHNVSFRYDVPTRERPSIPAPSVPAKVPAGEFSAGIRASINARLRPNRSGRPVRGDFPEYRPGARASGAETFWR